MFPCIQGYYKSSPRLFWRKLLILEFFSWHEKRKKQVSKTSSEKKKMKWPLSAKAPSLAPCNALDWLMRAFRNWWATCNLCVGCLLKKCVSKIGKITRLMEIGTLGLYQCFTTRISRAHSKFLNTNTFYKDCCTKPTCADMWLCVCKQRALFLYLYL